MVYEYLYCRAQVHDEHMSLVHVSTPFPCLYNFHLVSYVLFALPFAARQVSRLTATHGSLSIFFIALSFKLISVKLFL